jgi:hypothetical protein
MKTPEGFEKDKIKAYLKSIGAWYLVAHMTSFGKGGAPDILACLGGRFVGIEVKRPGKGPTPRQKTRIEEIKQAGGFACWGTADKVITELTLWWAGADDVLALGED